MLRGNGATQWASCSTMSKRGWVGIGHERFENSGSVLGQHPGRGYTGSRRSLTLQTRCHRHTLLVASYNSNNTQGNGGRILYPAHKGNLLTFIYCCLFIIHSSSLTEEQRTIKYIQRIYVTNRKNNNIYSVMTPL